MSVNGIAAGGAPAPPALSGPASPVTDLTARPDAPRSAPTPGAAPRAVAPAPVPDPLAEAIETARNRQQPAPPAEIRLSRDETTGRVLIELRDPESGEVLRQIPPEALLAAADQLRELAGELVDERS